jgi:U1 small nuclear ribonucleoprotein
VAGDPEKTILVARLAHEATERDLEKEFDQFGKIRRISLIRDREGRPRGYGFIEFEEQRAQKKAYKVEGAVFCCWQLSQRLKK